MIFKVPKTDIFFCRDWLPALKLPARENLSHVLFRWQSGLPSVDAGLPAAVADTLATALCANFWATFIAPSALNPLDALEQWTDYGTHWGQIQRRLWHPKMPLIWSREPAIVAQAFSEHWATEGQFILLSTQPEPLDFDAFKLQGDAALILKSLTHSDGAVGAFLPGVDGDFAGLYLTNEQRLQDFLNEDLAQACAREGIQLYPQSAADFAPGARLTV